MKNITETFDTAIRFLEDIRDRNEFFDEKVFILLDKLYALKLLHVEQKITKNTALYNEVTIEIENAIIETTKASEDLGKLEEAINKVSKAVSKIDKVSNKLV